ncbi:MAG: hypothetical protein R2838_17770 [Caldilineaceae bacterium]
MNIETTLRVDGFPLDYFPVTYPFFGINSTVAGVGFNIAKALHTLGDERLLTLVGRDLAGAQVRGTVAALGLDPATVRLRWTNRAVSHPLRSRRRRRILNLKDIKTGLSRRGVSCRGEDAGTCWCSLNYGRSCRWGRTGQTGGHGRPRHHRSGRRLQPRLHGPRRHPLHEPPERLPEPPDAWARRSRPAMHPRSRHRPGLGRVLLAQRCTKRDRRARSDHTPGGEHGEAGGTLFAAFVHAYAAHDDPLAALRRAVPGTRSASPAAAGFLTGSELEERYRAGLLALSAACRPRRAAGALRSPLLRRACRCGSRTPAPPPSARPPGSRVVTSGASS